MLFNLKVLYLALSSFTNEKILIEDIGDQAGLFCLDEYHRHVVEVQAQALKLHPSHDGGVGC